MNLLILGPQGSGKGTQSKLLCERFSLYDFDMGRIFRDLADTRPEIKEYMDRGELVPDDTVYEVATTHLRKINRYDGIAFDGFPRSRVQFHALKDVLEDKGFGVSLALFVNIPREESIKRLTARQEKEGRDDDTPGAIEKRLARYEKITKPLLEELSEMGLLEEVNGMGDVGAIHENIVKVLEARALI